MGATYKGLWTKWYKSVEARKAGWTRKRFTGLDKPPHYVSPTVTYVSGRDFTFKSASQVSVNTLTGRVLISYQGWSRHLTLLQKGAAVGEAKLWYERARNICLRTLCIRQDWMRTGQLSSAPDVTDREAKVARLQRYAELRWSSATSLLLKQEVLDLLALRLTDDGEKNVLQ